jgi:hypothetical protein
MLMGRLAQASTCFTTIGASVTVVSSYTKHEVELKKVDHVIPEKVHDRDYLVGNDSAEAGVIRTC